MKPIAIFNTDTIPTELAREHGQYPDMFIKSLSAVNSALRFERFDVNKQQYPQSLNEYAGVLITGSQSAAYDSDEWIELLKQRIKAMENDRVPLVGICFGHQIIHQALGGSVVNAPGGWCVGVHRNQLTESAVRYGTPGDSFTLLSSHQDQVVSVAPGTNVLAATDYCPIAMTSIGDHLLTLQGHPEFTRDYAKALMDKRRAAIGEPVYQRGVNSLVEPLDDGQALQWMLNVFSHACA
ncbi:glutamine amidotransferase-related protein [Gilvimarinus agarilyticus]|uniref:glutamine amidotransferase-related protein n=1 Tax=Gilvimarinus agarilyticus TaxID=679259 RepID=UPI0006980067|nr:gamma-glutamyl-gamma-aminobutyrate hydrolase family protein [Gilvimarinus agarilyticus]